MDISEEEFDLLARQVQQVRRQNRWLAALCGLIALALVLSLVMPIDTYRARRYELFDSENRRAAMWRVQDGVAAMILSDDLGRWRAVMAMEREGPRLVLNSPQGRPLVSLSTPDSRATLTMHDVAGRQRVRIVVDAGGPRMQFLDPQGVETASYPEPVGR